MTETILIVEDDKNLRDTLTDFLQMEGFDVYSAGTLKDARILLDKHSITLIVLDVMLPDGSGYQLASELRLKSSQESILMLTARTLENDLVEGFQSGADDYVTKPYRSRELLMRIKALVRRKSVVQSCQSHTEINGFKVDWKSMLITDRDQEIHLTTKAFKILQLFYQHLNQVLSREFILDEVWGKDVYVDNRTIDNFISTLKKQLNLTPENRYYIKSARSVGYALIKHSG